LKNYTANEDYNLIHIKCETLYVKKVPVCSCQEGNNGQNDNFQVI